MRCSVALALILGCATSKTVITESHTTSPGPFDRLAVFLSVPQRGDRGIYHGFKRTIANELAACSIESSVTPGVPDTRDGADASAAAAGSDARLIVRVREGQLRTVTTVDQAGSVVDGKRFKDMDLRFWLELFDFKLNRVTWLAFADLHMDAAGTAGDELAHAIVARLRSDGVLTRCGSTR